MSYYDQDLSKPREEWGTFDRVPHEDVEAAYKKVGSALSTPESKYIRDRRAEASWGGYDGYRYDSPYASDISLSEEELKRDAVNAAKRRYQSKNIFYKMFHKKIQWGKTAAKGYHDYESMSVEQIGRLYK